jgi:hypothetical protein
MSYTNAGSGSGIGGFCTAISEEKEGADSVLGSLTVAVRTATVGGCNRHREAAAERQREMVLVEDMVW